MAATLPIYILAGGRSSRFGSDKARAIVDGRPLIARIADAVAPVAARIRVVADQPGKYADLGLATIADVNGGFGPMSGLQAALHDCDQPWLALLSCDLLKLDPAWIQRLLAARTASADIVAFRHDHWEPLIALYHQRLRDEVDARVRRQQLRMQALLDERDTIAVPPPPDWPQHLQANTPADLAAGIERKR